MSFRKLAGSLAVLIVAAGVLAAAAFATVRHHHRGGHHPTRTVLCGLDVEWLKTSIQGDVFEIRGGRLALSKSSNAAVKTLGQRLVTDHTQSLAEALQLAKKYGIDAEQE